MQSSNMYKTWKHKPKKRPLNKSRPQKKILENPHPLTGLRFESLIRPGPKRSVERKLVIDA